MARTALQAMGEPRDRGVVTGLASVAGLPAGQDVGHDRLGGVRGDGEADADVAAAPGRGDRGVDADHLAVGVHERSPGVARVEWGVGLDGVADRLRPAETRLLLAVPDGELAVQRADDAGRDRALEAE